MFGQLLDPVMRVAKSEMKREAQRQMEQTYYSGELRTIQYAALCIRAIRGKLRRCFASRV
jgi:hypothetical protein